MTTSSWDKIEIEKNFATCMNLGEIITQIESDFSSRGEVICEISVNGVQLQEADEAKFATSPLDSVFDLLIRSNTPGELITGALTSAEAFIPELSRACIETSELFRTADVNRAHRSFTEALDGCQWLVDTLVHVRGAAMNTGAPVEEAARWLEAERATNKIVTEVATAFSVPDLVLVADLLEYEMPAVLGIWSQAIATERERRV